MFRLLFSISRANISLKTFLHYFLIWALLTNSFCYGRSFPRYSSRSIRFPTDSIENAPSTSAAILPRSEDVSKALHEPTTYGHSRSASIPESPHSPTSLSNEIIEEEGLESNEEFQTAFVEIIKPISSADEKFVGNQQNTTEADEEELRKLLCSINAFNDDESPPDEKETPSTKIETTSSKITKTPHDDNDEDTASQLRYDLQHGKCGKVGEKEHCGENMIFVAEIDSGAYGYCECDFENKIKRRPSAPDGKSSSANGTVPYSTPLVYHPETMSCYHLYEKAYCNENEWLVLSREIKGPVCEPRKCLSSLFSRSSSSPTKRNKSSRQNGRKEGPVSRRRTSKLLTPELWADDVVSRAAESQIHDTVNQEMGLWVPLNGNGPCVLLNRENSEFCEFGEKVLFNTGDIFPQCRIPGRAIEGRAIVKNACPPGSFYSIIGRCQPDWDF